MRKPILLAAAVLTAAITMSAQTGSTVREGVFWNYNINNEFLSGEIISTKTDLGYHFNGGIEKDGKYYLKFMNQDGLTTALMREEDGRVYLYNDHYSEDDLCNEEYLLYDFNAQIGDTYEMLPFVSPESNGIFFDTISVTVTDTYTLNINNHESRVQTIVCMGNEMTLVEGIGLDAGLICFPQPAWLHNGMKNTYARLQSVTDADGNILFSGYDFPPFGNIVREDCIWDYSVSEKDCNSGDVNTSDDCGYHFKGYRVIDDKVYRRLLDGSDNEVALLREWLNTVYLYLDENLKSSLFPESGESPSEFALYDFNLITKQFDAIRFDCSYFCYPSITEISVIESEYIEAEGHSLMLLTSTIGNKSGYQYAHCAGAITGWLHKPQWDSTDLNEKTAHLKCVRNRHGSVILSSSDFESADCIYQVENERNGILYKDRSLITDKSFIYVYDSFGRDVAHGYELVSTLSLQQGVYVAKTDTHTLKILVK